MTNGATSSQLIAQNQVEAFTMVNNTANGDDTFEYAYLYCVCDTVELAN